jgi:hypothetical protein
MFSPWRLPRYLVVAETITDQELEFQFDVPAGFSALENPADLSPDIRHALRADVPLSEQEIPLLLAIARLREVLSNQPLDVTTLPPGSAARHFRVEWQGLLIDALEVPEATEGLEIITFNAQVPLKREAIQLQVVGPAHRREELLSLMQQVLRGLKGESNWLKPGAPDAIAVSSDYGTILLVVAATSVIGGLIGLYILSLYTQKGVVLAIAIMLYFASHQIDAGRQRELYLLVGIMRMLGFAGGILGLLDLFRSRPATENVDAYPGAATDHEGSESTPVSSAPPDTASASGTLQDASRKLETDP